MSGKKPDKDKNQKHDALQVKKQDAKIKAFIQMIDVKADTNMTRVYSAICKSEFLNPE